ncbi:MAG: hypothetical protein VB141_12265, partial [Burkholderia gladioli]
TASSAKRAFYRTALSELAVPLLPGPLQAVETSHVPALANTDCLYGKKMLVCAIHIDEGPATATLATDYTWKSSG